MLAYRAVLGAAVGVEVPAEQLPRSVDRLEHHRAGSVGEQDGGVAVGPVGDAGEGVGADDQDLVGSRSR